MKILKVFFVDDESIVITDLRSLIDWEKHGFCIVGWAFSANTALSLIRDTVPDIVFMDISLPVMDGIELSRLIKQQYPGMTIVTLSGYMEFSYAQRAIDAGIYTYLVKHQLTPEKLVDVLSHIREMKDKEENSSRMMRRQILVNMLQTKQNAASLSPVEQEFLDIFDEPFSLLLSAPVEPILAAHTENPIPYKDASAALSELDLFQPMFLLDRFAFENTFVLLLKRPASPDLIERAIPEIHAVLNESLGVSFFTVYQRRLTTIKSFDTDYATVHACLSRYIFCRDTAYTLSDSLPDGAPTADGKILDTSFINLELFQNSNNVMMSKTGYLLYELCQTHNYKGFIACVHSILHLLTGLDDRFISESCEINRIIDAKEMAGFLMARLKEYHLSGKRRAYSYDVDFVVSYIGSNYGKNPTIGAAAQLLHVNSMYLGQKFKKETGKTFSNCLTSYRVEHAKTLLATSTLNISEIAEKVGIVNSQYFSKIFRQNTGMTPNTFRKSTPRKILPAI